MVEAQIEFGLKVTWEGGLGEKKYLLGGLFRASNLRAFPGKVQGMIRPGELLCAAPVRCVPRVSRKGLLLRTRGRVSIVERSDRLTMLPRHVIKCLPSRMRGESLFRER